MCLLSPGSLTHFFYSLHSSRTGFFADSIGCLCPVCFALHDLSLTFVHSLPTLFVVSMMVLWFTVLIYLHLVRNRVHAHAAAALINFCEGVERDTLIPYLDPIVERLLKLLNPAGLSSANADANGAGNENGTGVKRYVQEQVITTLAMVADASEATFAKVSFSLFRFALEVVVVGWS